MRGLFVSKGVLSLRDDLPQPAPGKGEALIRVTLAGICRTDLEVLNGYRPFDGVPGHEFVGIVVESDDPAWNGARVVGEINIACGRCDLCRRNMPSHCRHRAAIGINGHDGAMAEYIVLPQANLHRVPDSVSDEEAVFVEPLAAALEILEQVHIAPDETVIVLGDGKLGLLVAQVIARTGCRLIAAGHHAHKLALLAQRGIETTTDTSTWGRKVDVVVDCTGRPEGFQEACRLVRPRGTIVLKSTFAGRVTTDLSQLVVDEVHCIGSRCGPFEPALRLLAGHQVEVRRFIEATYPLEEGLTVFTHAGQPGVLKVLIRPPA